MAEAFRLVLLGVASIFLWEILKTGYMRGNALLWNRRALRDLFDMSGRVVISRSIVSRDDNKISVRDPDARIASTVTHLLSEAPHYDDSPTYFSNPTAHLIVIGSPRYNPHAEAIQRKYQLPFEYVFASAENDPGARTMKLITEYGDELAASVDRREEGNQTEVDYGILLIGKLENDKRVLWVSGIHGSGTEGVFHYLQTSAPAIRHTLGQLGGKGCCWLLRVRYRKSGSLGEVEIVDVELLGSPRAVEYRQTDHRPRVLICDLGGVLMYFDRARTYRAIAHHLAMSYEHIQSIIEETDLRERYEVGQLSDDDFCARLTEALGADAATLPLPLLREYWGDIFWPNPEIAEALRYLKAQQFRLILLSNTNPLHYQYVSRDYPDVLRLFDEIILSFEVGLAKPNAELLTRALRSAITDKDASSDDVLFVDDKEEHVLAARKVGMSAFVFRSYPHFIFWLRRQGAYVP